MTPITGKSLSLLTSRALYCRLPISYWTVWNRYWSGVPSEIFYCVYVLTNGKVVECTNTVPYCLLVFSFFALSMDRVRAILCFNKTRTSPECPCYSAVYLSFVVSDCNTTNTGEIILISCTQTNHRWKLSIMSRKTSFRATLLNTVFSVPRQSKLLCCFRGNGDYSSVPAFPCTIFLKVPFSILDSFVLDLPLANEPGLLLIAEFFHSESAH